MPISWRVLLASCALSYVSLVLLELEEAVAERDGRIQDLEGQLVAARAVRSEASS